LKQKIPPDMRCAIYNASPWLTNVWVTVPKVVINVSNPSPKCEMRAIIATGASQHLAKKLTRTATRKQWIGLLNTADASVASA